MSRRDKEALQQHLHDQDKIREVLEQQQRSANLCSAAREHQNPHTHQHQRRVDCIAEDCEEEEGSEEFDTAQDFQPPRFCRTSLEVFSAQPFTLDEKIRRWSDTTCFAFAPPTAHYTVSTSASTATMQSSSTTSARKRTLPNLQVSRSTTV